jgi:hypothetical protein
VKITCLARRSITDQIVTVIHQQLKFLFNKHVMHLKPERNMATITFDNLSQGRPP